MICQRWSRAQDPDLLSGFGAGFGLDGIPGLQAKGFAGFLRKGGLPFCCQRKSRHKLNINKAALLVYGLVRRGTQLEGTTFDVQLTGLKIQPKSTERAIGLAGGLWIGRFAKPESGAGTVD
jgi:hypothetical protein